MDEVLTSALPASWLTSRLGVRQIEIKRLRERGELFAERRDKTEEWLYPVWQFGPGGTIPASIRQLVHAAHTRGISEQRVVSLLHRRVGLVGGRRFLDLLFEGRADYVLAALGTV
jgi:hypothetical protein